VVNIMIRPIMVKVISFSNMIIVFTKGQTKRISLPVIIVFRFGHDSAMEPLRSQSYPENLQQLRVHLLQPMHYDLKGVVKHRQAGTQTSSRHP